MTRGRSAALVLYLLVPAGAIHTGNTGDGDAAFSNGFVQDGGIPNSSPSAVIPNASGAGHSLTSPGFAAADNQQRTSGASIDETYEGALVDDDGDDDEDDGADDDGDDLDEDVDVDDERLDNVDDAGFDEDDLDDGDVDDYAHDDDEGNDGEDDEDDDEDEHFDDDEDEDFDDEEDKVDEKSDDEDNAVEQGVRFANDVPLEKLKGKPDILGHVKSEKKPGLILVTSSTCPVCHNLIKSVNGDAKAKAEMKKFVAVSAVDSAGNEWKAQGEATYWPRVYFVKDDGSFYPVTAPKAKYPHYFWNAAQLTAAMTHVLAEAK
jgi:hypothetical protein